jgi:hypothetical protein
MAISYGQRLSEVENGGQLITPLGANTLVNYGTFLAAGYPDTR